MEEKDTYYMFFDVESRGLHGEGFAFGYVISDHLGNTLNQGRYFCPVSRAKTSSEYTFNIQDYDIDCYTVDDHVTMFYTRLTENDKNLVDDLLKNIRNTLGGDKLAEFIEQTYEDDCWLDNNINFYKDDKPNCISTNHLRREFWKIFTSKENMKLVSYTSWPVESNFLRSCVESDISRYWQGPFPLLDLSTLLHCRGYKDSDELLNRLNDGTEEEHCPLGDARHLKRIWFELQSIGDQCGQ